MIRWMPNSQHAILGLDSKQLPAGLPVAKVVV